MIVWVTGASSGLGLYTAQALRDAGHTVIAGARSFQREENEGIHRVPLDVTSEDSVADFVSQAWRISPRLDALVQCAGVLTLGACEEIPVEEYRRIMETNFLGMVRMNQQVLPLMRRQGGGRIVLFSSINGLLGIPFQSAYVASKHAIEGYAECLQMEARPYGIQVCLVEPGDHRGGSEAYRGRIAPAGSPYGQDFLRGTAVIRHDEQNGSDPAKLGRGIVRALGRRRMPFRLRVASADQHLAVYLHKLLPARLNERVLRSYYLGKSRKTSGQ
ncbi:MAG: SDR family oxidoreductase [Clostridiales bacterium]|nr:SDR family oxidoreductase [Clostridiales bacterium]